MTSREKYELEQAIGKLPLVEQLEIVEAILRNLRRANEDHEAMAREVEEMAKDPDMQRVLRGEDLVRRP